ncbi:MAG: hypothetical protein AAFX02_09830 [Pseudomonadota bacterium]
MAGVRRKAISTLLAILGAAAPSAIAQDGPIYVWLESLPTEERAITCLAAAYAENDGFASEETDPWEAAVNVERAWRSSHSAEMSKADQSAAIIAYVPTAKGKAAEAVNEIADAEGLELPTGFGGRDLRLGIVDAACHAAAFDLPNAAEFGLEKP